MRDISAVTVKSGLTASMCSDEICGEIGNPPFIWGAPSMSCGWRLISAADHISPAAWGGKARGLPRRELH